MLMRFVGIDAAEIAHNVSAKKRIAIVERVRTASSTAVSIVS